MISQTLDDAMLEACRAVQINPPKRQPVPGRWALADTYERNGKGDGRILIFDDGQGGVAWNHQTQRSQRFSIRGQREAGLAPAPRRDPAAERRKREERAEVERTCESIVRACRHEPHPYLAAKGFPGEPGLICDDVWRHLPVSPLGEAMGRALPEGEGPLLIVPGRIGKRIATVQFITPEGAKKNILRGQMGSASHRIATGRETWVCEGIATALSVRAALRMLGRSATVLSAFSASNVAKVAAGIPGAIIAADHDKPIEALHGLGTGEFYARGSGRKWVMPPDLGDFNDLHEREGLRAVALLLREVRPP